MEKSNFQLASSHIAYCLAPGPQVEATFLLILGAGPTGAKYCHFHFRICEIREIRG
jgi:hypothetical protein